MSALRSSHDDGEKAHHVRRISCLLGVRGYEVTDSYEDITEELYKVNANISAVFIAMNDKPTRKDMEMINLRLGGLIKRLRELNDGRKID